MRPYLAMMSNTTAYGPRSFIIIEPDPVVGLDLSGILGTAFAGAALSMFRTIGEAEKHIASAASSVCILLNAKAATSGMLPLLRECVAKGGEVMFIGDAADVGFPAYFVQVPFTSEMILTTLTGRLPDGFT